MRLFSAPIYEVQSISNGRFALNKIFIRNAELSLLIHVFTLLHWVPFPSLHHVPIALQELFFGGMFPLLVDCGFTRHSGRIASSREAVLQVPNRPEAARGEAK